MRIFSLLLLTVSIQITAQNFSRAIEDNSYYIEEAYNQEDWVIQHISNFAHFPKPLNESMFTFTEEWPVAGQTSQLSYTIPYSFTSGASGVGDILINYRYQLTGHDDVITTAPRISIILPTGDAAKGTGTGKTGFQLNLPVSKRLSEAFAAHFNLGYTLIPGVEAGLSKENLYAVNAGGSLIWLISYNVNFMIEYLFNRYNDFNFPSGTSVFSEHIINPGMRFAIDLNSLQIVPGFSVPVILDGSSETAGFFLYISFEHPI